MGYIQGNKAGWEEAFTHRTPGWGEDDYKRLLSGEHLPFWFDDAARVLDDMQLEGKAIAQFCCNNGRELLAAMALGPAKGVGFDIAENILAQAKQTARKANIQNCEFVQTDILEIGEEYAEQFDLGFFTIGAITWFRDLAPLFQRVYSCLKPSATLLIHDFHPVVNMLPLNGEEGYDPQDLGRLQYSYFRTEPWIETGGIGYISGPIQAQHTLTSFTHTMADIVNAAIAAGFQIQRLEEYDYDIGMEQSYNGMGLPLSFILLAGKE